MRMRFRPIFPRLLAALGLLVAASCSDDLVAPTTGSIEVTTSTSGPEPDLDGYSISADGGAAQPISLNANLTVSGLNPGSHQVALGGLAANCAVTGDNPRSTNVPAGGTVKLSFAITCSAASGTIEVTTATTGGEPDDGYTVAVDDGTTQPVGANEKLTVSNVAQGAHLVTIAGVSHNCTLAGDNPRAVNVSGGITTTLTFSVQCITTLTRSLAFTSDRDSPNKADNPHTKDIYLLRTDGELVRLTPASSYVSGRPAWSPDGRKIVFGNSDIQVIAVDASQLTNLTNHPANDHSPAWSPDGKKIAFSSYRVENCCSDIFVMSADGSGVTNLSSDYGADFEHSPSWSPDGLKIGFRREEGTPSPYVAVMDANGPSPHLVIPNSYGNGAPQWSPDGSRFMFFAGADQVAIYTVRPDGTDQTLLTGGPCLDAFYCRNVDPAWSPDGSRIVFASNRDELQGDSQELDIYIMNADGTGVTRLTNAPGGDYTPQWSPDSQKIAFVSLRDGNAEIYVMNPDGSGQTNITNNPADDRAPSWSP